VAQEGINLTNIAYLCGFDSIYFDGVFVSLSLFRPHRNFFVKTVCTLIESCHGPKTDSRDFLKNEPRWDVRPKSGDEEDKDAARLAEQVILQLWDQLEINNAHTHDHVAPAVWSVYLKYAGPNPWPEASISKAQYGNRADGI